MAENGFWGELSRGILGRSRAGWADEKQHLPLTQVEQPGEHQPGVIGEQDIRDVPVGAVTVK
jgi:hypothetical protein